MRAGPDRRPPQLFDAVYPPASEIPPKGLDASLKWHARRFKRLLAKSEHSPERLAAIEALGMVSRAAEAISKAREALSEARGAAKVAVEEARRVVKLAKPGRMEKVSKLVRKDTATAMLDESPLGLLKAIARAK